MSIELTILGFLSWAPQSGYDLKKRFSSVDFIPWSGNNNQIYRILLRLHSEGLVNTEVEQNKVGPVRKIYSLTDKGYTALKNQLLAEPELEQIKNTFLVQLAFTEILETRLILQLLEDYSSLLEEKVLIIEEELRRKRGFPERSERENLIWTSIMKRKLDSLESEKNWAKNLSESLKEKYCD